MPMFPAFDGPVFTHLFSHEEVGASAFRVELAEHTGTHVDAPRHFDPTGLAMDALPAELLFLRPFKKFNLSALDPQPGQLISESQLRDSAERGGFVLDAGDVAIVEMGWDQHWPTQSGEHTRSFWGSNMPGLGEDACRYLFEAGIAAVASDTAACDNAVVEGQIGHAHGHSEWFLPRGIPIIEGLRGLAQVPACGLFVALPLRLKDGTGAPARVLLLHS
jgi:kynurenine formamidase